MVKHHDILREYFIQTSEGDWIQNCQGVEQSSSFLYKTFDLSELSEGEQRIQLEKLNTQLQETLNITEGYVWGAALFDLGNHEQRLLLFAHHLVIDGVSWRILIEDLGRVYEQLSEQLSVKLPQKTTSYQEWSLALQH